MKLSEELTWRGLVNQTTYPSLAELDASPVNFYWGVDPSADSMTIGNLAAAMMVRCFIRHGHKPFLLIGGATGLIGDPDGKTTERSLLSKDQIAANKKAIVSQYHQIFKAKKLKVVDNLDWFKSVGYLDFLRDVGKNVPLRQMLGREFVDSRLGERGSGLSYAEFSYVLIQAYDFLHLYKTYGVSLQVCGADQWGNSIAGVDLIRRKTGGQAHVYAAPLVVDQSTGQKFGKTETGAIWLDPHKTSPTQFYQFWVNAPDAQVEAYLKIFTDISPAELTKLMAAQKLDPAKRLAQQELALKVTELVHGPKATKIARQVTNILTGQTSLTELKDRHLVQTIRQEIGHAKTSARGSLAEALTASGLASSKTDARQLIKARSIYLNGQSVNKEQFEPTDFIAGRALVRRGKAFKDSALIELG